MTKNGNKSSGIWKSVAYFIIAALLYNFVWNVYIVNPTALDAIAKEDGRQSILTNIDKKQSLGISKLEDGFRVYAISKSFLSWTITDDTFIENESMDKIFITKEKPLQFKGNKEIDVILIATNNKDISTIIAYDQKNEPINLAKVPHNGSNLYYAYSEGEFMDEITYKAYSSDGKLLDQQ